MIKLFIFLIFRAWNFIFYNWCLIFLNIFLSTFFCVFFLLFIKISNCRAIMTACGDEDDCTSTPEAADLARKLEQKEIDSLPRPGEVDFIIGGPPCQVSRTSSLLKVEKKKKNLKIRLIWRNISFTKSPCD